VRIKVWTGLIRHTLLNAQGINGRIVLKRIFQVGDENVGSINQEHSCEQDKRLSVSVKGEDRLG
jgi:hypothetical protein